MCLLNLHGTHDGIGGARFQKEGCSPDPVTCTCHMPLTGGMEERGYDCADNPDGISKSNPVQVGFGFGLVLVFFSFSRYHPLRCHTWYTAALNV